MSQTTTASRWVPRVPQGRLLGIDVLRALAILGMVWTHFSLAGWVTTTSPAQSPPVLEWVNQLFHVRSRDIFFVLAGVTVALVTGGAARHRGRELGRSAVRVVLRALVLFVFALVLGQFGWWGVQILHYYALWIVLLLPLTMVRARTLFVIAGALALVAPVCQLLQNNLGLFEPDLQVMLRLREHAGFALLVHPEDWLPTLQHVIVGVTATSQDTIAVLPFLVLGLALGRLDLRDRLVRSRMVRAGLGTTLGAIVVAVVAMYPFGTAKTVATAGQSGHDDAQAPWQELLTLGSPGPAHTVFSIVECVGMMGLIAALLGGLLTAMDRQFWRRALWPVAAFGSMALTWYFVHFLVLGSDVFTTAQGRSDNRTVLAFAVFVAAACACSVLWRLWARRGPLEYVQHRVVGFVPNSRHRSAASAEVSAEKAPSTERT